MNNIIDLLDEDHKNKLQDEIIELVKQRVESDLDECTSYIMLPDKLINICDDALAASRERIEAYVKRYFDENMKRLVRRIMVENFKD